MELMDDTLADDSGIPCLSHLEDIPVHSTPIKGDKIPLPSTKNMMKNLRGKLGRYEEYTEAESVVSIRNCDLPPRNKPLSFTRKGQGQIELQSGRDGPGGDPRMDFRKESEYGERNFRDLSNIDNLRKQHKSYPAERRVHEERSRSPVQGQKSDTTDMKDGYKRQLDVHLPAARMENDEDEFGIPRSLTEDMKNKQIDKIYPEKKGNSSAKNASAFSNYRASSKEIGAKNFDEKERQRDMTSAKASDSVSRTKSEEHSKTNVDSRKEESTKFSLSTLASKFNVEYTETRHTHETTKSASASWDLRTNRTVDGRERQEASTEVRRYTVNKLRNTPDTSAAHSKTLSSSKQNSSFSELENTTLQKQRQEIQLLMTELKDRDRELSDMMTSHQQQLVAWQQDRDRLVTLERKCVQHEDDLRRKTTELRNALTNLKALKSSEIEHKRELESYLCSIEELKTENSNHKTEIEDLKRNNEDLQGSVNTLSNKLGKLEAREEELTTSLRLKEKDISSATTHMKELSERLQQLDLRCKECQDREKEALKEKQEWKQKYNELTEEYQIVKCDLETKRREVIKLSEENKSARQQLALIQREAGMMERCKDELIESMRVKQERTDTQLRNLRELFDRQMKEITSLQVQLDNSKELIYRQQNSIDEQQSSSSYQVRLSQVSEYSMERTTGSQKPANKVRSPTHSRKYREPDMTGSHHQTQSSGYQSQLYENQTGNQNVPNSSENDGPDLTGFKPGQRHSGVVSSGVKGENQADHESDSAKCSVFSKKSDSYFKVEVTRRSSDPFLSDSKTSQESHNYGTPPKHQRKLSFDSPKRQDGYVVTEMYPKDIKPDSPTRSETCALSEVAVLAIGKARCMLENEHGGVDPSSETNSSALTNSHDGVKNVRFRQQVNSQTEKECVTKSRSDLYSESNNVGEGNLYSKQPVEGRRETEVGSSDKDSNSNFTETCDDIERDYAKRYTFENKLSSFLEDLEDIDDIDSIWDEKPAVNSANISTLESSPASKLRRLLLESQQMIQSLEKSSESPRQIRIPSDSLHHPPQQQQQQKKPQVQQPAEGTSLPSQKSGQN